MYFINPFKGLRPTKENASSVTIASTDHMSNDIVKNHKKNNPWSYLNIFESDNDSKSKEKFELMKTKSILTKDNKNSFYIYKISAEDHSQVGIIGTAKLSAYDNYYRYFPDPDLLPLEFTDEFINELKKKIPELPDEKKKRFIEKFKLSPYEANILVSDIDTSKYFEAVIKNSDIKLSTNWITGELFALLNEKNFEITQSPISAQNLSKLINLIKDGTISGKIAKTVFEIMAVGDVDPQKIIDEKGLKQQSDPKELEKIVDKVINENQDKVKEFKSGKEKLFGFFVGQVMKISGGKANPQLVNDILKKKLI